MLHAGRRSDSISMVPMFMEYDMNVNLRRKRITIWKSGRHVFNVKQWKAIWCHSIFFRSSSIRFHISTLFKHIYFPSEKRSEKVFFFFLLCCLGEGMRAINVIQKLIRYKWIEFQVRPIGRKADWRGRCVCCTWRKEKRKKSFLGHIKLFNGK